MQMKSVLLGVCPSGDCQVFLWIYSWKYDFLTHKPLCSQNNISCPPLSLRKLEIMWAPISISQPCQTPANWTLKLPSRILQSWLLDVENILKLLIEFILHHAFCIFCWCIYSNDGHFGVSIGKSSCNYPIAGGFPADEDFCCSPPEDQANTMFV